MQILDRRTDNIKKVQSALVPPPFYSNFFHRTMAAPQISQRIEPFVSNCWNSIGRDYIVRGVNSCSEEKGFYKEVTSITNSRI